MYVKKSPTFAYHRKKFGEQSKVGYKDIIAMFKPEKFDAEAWAELFAASGAKFAGPGQSPPGKVTPPVEQQ